ncbi:MAG: carbohydrate ABC transporter permease [Anaerolineae bacterium]
MTVSKALASDRRKTSALGRRKWHIFGWTGTTPKLVRAVLRVEMLYALAIVGSITFLFPFAWTVSTSLKIAEQVWHQPPIWIPNPIEVGNYVRAFTTVPTLAYLKNTLTVVLVATVGLVVSSSLVAYSFSRLQWRGRDKLFLLVLSTMMLPSQVTMIPMFLIFHQIHWTNTLKPLIVPAYFGGAFEIFLLRQFFLTIPVEFDEAAVMDGATPLTIWARVILPLAKPALAAVAIFAVVFYWNDFLGPLIYLNDVEKWTLPLGLLSFQTRMQTRWAELMAYTVMVMMPCLIVFFLFQRYFIQGIVLTGLKG